MTPSLAFIFQSCLLRVDPNLEAEASHVGALKRDIERLVPYVNAGGFRAKSVAILDSALMRFPL